MRSFIQFLVDNKEKIGSAISSFVVSAITTIGIFFSLFGNSGCVAGDGVVKEIAYCIKNVCTVKGVPVVVEDTTNQQ